MEPMPRKDLEFSLSYALWRSLKQLKRAKGIEDCRGPARQIVDHLQLAGLVAMQRPPRPLHGALPAKEGDGS